MTAAPDSVLPEGTARIRRLTWISGLLVGLAVMGATWLGALTIRHYREIEARWFDYDLVHEEKNIQLMEMRQHLGHNGLPSMIGRLAEGQGEGFGEVIGGVIEDLQSVITEYRSFDVDAEEISALDTLRSIVADYGALLPRSPDAPAPPEVTPWLSAREEASHRALTALEEAWTRGHEHAHRRFDEALSAGRDTIGYGFTILPAFVLVGITVLVLLRRLTGEVAERGLRLQAVMESVGDGIVVIDEEGIIENFNHGAETIFGYSAAEAVGKSVAILMTEPHRGGCLGSMADLVRTGDAKIGGKGCTLDGLRRDGSIFPLHLVIGTLAIRGRRLFTGIFRDVTGEVEAQRLLREREERLSSTLDAIDEGIWDWNIATGTVFYSDRWCRLFGLEPEEVAARIEAREDLIHPDDRERVAGRLARHLADETDSHVSEHRVRRRDGSWIWVLERGRVIHWDGEGKPLRLVGAVLDISGRRGMEERLRISEERYQRSQLFANIGTWDWEVRTGKLYWSERIAPLFGHSAGELETSYENFLAAIHPEDRDRVIDAVKACLEKGEEYEIEHRVVWPDGTVHWLLERGDVIRDPEGRPLHMLGVVQDVTDRVEAEHALEASRQWLAVALENLSDGIALFDADDRLVMSNTRFRRLYPNILDLVVPGVSFEALLRGAVERGQFPDALEAPETWIADRLERHRSPSAVFEERLDGQRWIRVAERRLPDGGSVGIRVEVTTFREAQERAEAANRAKSEFLSSMSHELRTPLNAIIGFSQLLQSNAREPLTETQSTYVDFILKGGRHLLDLINEVLDLAKVESGRLVLTIGDVDPVRVVEECVTMVRPEAERRRVTVVADGLAGGGLPVVQGDYTRLKQVLLNLLSNAVKYNREGGWVRLSHGRTPEGMLRLSITDTGPGIPAEKQALLFEPFSRLGGEHSGVEGTGIGLTITRELMHRMGGAIDFESTEGRGSTFWIDIPLKADDANGTAASEERQASEKAP